MKLIHYYIARNEALQQSHAFPVPLVQLKYPQDISASEN